MSSRNLKPSLDLLVVPLLLFLLLFILLYFLTVKRLSTCGGDPLASGGGLVRRGAICCPQPSPMEIGPGNSPGQCPGSLTTVRINAGVHMGSHSEHKAKLGGRGRHSSPGCRVLWIPAAESVYGAGAGCPGFEAPHCAAPGLSSHRHLQPAKVTGKSGRPGAARKMLPIPLHLLC